MVIFGIYVKFLGCIHPGSQVVFLFGKRFRKVSPTFYPKIFGPPLDFLSDLFFAAFDRTSSEKFVLRSKNRQQTSAERWTPRRKKRQRWEANWKLLFWFGVDEDFPKRVGDSRFLLLSFGRIPNRRFGRYNLPSLRGSRFLMLALHIYIYVFPQQTIRTPEPTSKKKNTNTIHSMKWWLVAFFQWGFQ